MTGNTINNLVEKGKQETLFLIRELLSGSPVRATLLPKMFLSLDKGVIAPDVPYIRARLMSENEAALAGVKADDPRLLPAFAQVTGRLMQLKACIAALERIAQAGDATEDPSSAMARDFMGELERLEPLLARIWQKADERGAAAISV